MRGIELAKKILALADVVYHWLGALTQLEPERKARVARGAEAIADTLVRAADALSQIDGRSANPATDLRARPYRD